MLALAEEAYLVSNIHRNALAARLGPMDAFQKN
jgi:hypothetical protein